MKNVTISVSECYWQHKSNQRQSSWYRAKCVHVRAQISKEKVNNLLCQKSHPTCYTFSYMLDTFFSFVFMRIDPKEALRFKAFESIEYSCRFTRNWWSFMKNVSTFWEAKPKLKKRKVPRKTYNFFFFYVCKFLSLVYLKHLAHSRKTLFFSHVSPIFPVYFTL